MYESATAMWLFHQIRHQVVRSFNHKRYVSLRYPGNTVDQLLPVFRSLPEGIIKAEVGLVRREGTIKLQAWNVIDATLANFLPRGNAHSDRRLFDALLIRRAANLIINEPLEPRCRPRPAPLVIKTRLFGDNKPATCFHEISN